MKKTYHLAFLKIVVTGALLSLFSASIFADSKVEDLVEKLFLRLDVRHREILSIEENITHNRSEIEKQSLIRILEQKVRNFIKMEAQVATVLDDMKNSKEKKKVFLFRKSMDRLDHYRKNMDQIQELYFRKPIVVSPEIEISTGQSNFEDFLSNWEDKKPVGSGEKKVRRAVIPVQEKKYFDHAKKTHKQAASASSYQDFLQNLEPATPMAQHEVMAPQDKMPVDKYYERLHKEKRSPRVKVLKQDQHFSNFYSQMEENIEEQAKRAEHHEVQAKGGSPFNVQKQMLEELREVRKNETPLQALMHDLNRMTEEKRNDVVQNNRRKQGDSFSNFYDQLELSNVRKEQAMVEVRRGVGADEEFRNFVSKARQEVKKESAKKAADAPDNPFAAFTDAMHNTESREGEKVAYAKDKVINPKSRVSFSQAFGEIPEERHLVKAEKKPEKKEEPNTNRYRVILNTLKKDNQKKIEESHYLVPEERQLEDQLKTVFTVKSPKKQKDGRDLKVVENAGPSFDPFPGNIKDTGERPKLDKRLEVTNLGNQRVSYASMKKKDETGVVMEEKPLMSPTASSSGEPAAPVGEAPSGDELSNEVSPMEDRYSRLAQARLLRKGASLIPIVIETRDTKDRLYQDLPIRFEVEMKPDNFVVGQILDSFTDSPLSKTVATNREGVAQIHLLLDLQQQEVNISRRIMSSSEETICKVLITPKF